MSKNWKIGSFCVLEVELTWKRFFTVAWAFFWRSLLCSMIMGAFVGAFTASMIGLIYADAIRMGNEAEVKELAVYYAKTFSTIAGFITEAFVLKLVLNKKFKEGYKIGLISTVDEVIVPTESGV